MKLRTRRKVLSRLRANHAAKKGMRPVPSAATIRATMRKIYNEHRALFERLADA